jgi:phthiocerol/phenolphthiocerol synthesis type-I polyketide synthase E
MQRLPHAKRKKAWSFFFAMRSHLHELPNGMGIVDQCRAETQQFYHDIFVKRVYLKHGICVGPEDVVFDVGANIGLFTLFIHSIVPGARIFAFEPAPPLFRLLQANVNRHGVNARLFPFGLGIASTVLPFTFYPNSCGMSSFYPDEKEERAALGTVMRNELQIRGPQPGVDVLLDGIGDLLDHRLQCQVYECRMETLSAVLVDACLDRIDLLKIDAQKSEVDVLRGLRKEDWCKIRQMVIEVHDGAGRLDVVCSLLAEYGYEVLIEQDELYRASTHFMIYATTRFNPSKADEREQNDRLQYVTQRAQKQADSYVSVRSRVRPH